MLKEILEELKPYGAQLIAVSKTKPPEVIRAVYDQGHRIFGENRVNELVEKYEILPKDIRWHMIGHLQRNKVKYLMPCVDLIHSVDSLRLFKEINKEAKKNQRSVEVLIQIKIAEEETKAGLDPDMIDDFFQSEVMKDSDFVRIVGVMGMASFVDNETQVRNEFRKLADYFKSIKTRYFPNEVKFREISMGMSGDYKIALEEGATMVRIGSLIFGAR